MQTKQELYAEARRQVALRRQRAETLAAEARARALEAVPGLAELQDEQRRLGFEAAKLAAMGAGSEKYEAVLARRGALKEEEARLLAAAGLGAGELQAKYVCPLCRDTGVKDGRPCRCVTEVMRALRRQELLSESPLTVSSFADLDLSFYPSAYDKQLQGSVRDYMKAVLDDLQAYAESFDSRSSNLLITGNAGLGKTHAALAIAGTVLSRGRDVIYISSQSLFDHLERARFEDEDPWAEAVQEADLLILDDLGTEFASAYMLSCFYDLLNTRLGCRRPTIITTNIVDGMLFEKRYTEKIASRLGGSFETVEFLGEDIRALKKAREEG